MARIIGYGVPFNGKYADSKKCKVRELKSLVTFSYGQVCKAHVTEDDHCYIVWIWHENDIYMPTHYIFDDALKILKKLPDPYSDAHRKLREKANVMNKVIIKEISAKEAGKMLHDALLRHKDDKPSFAIVNPFKL